MGGLESGSGPPSNKQKGKYNLRKRATTARKGEQEGKARMQWVVDGHTRLESWGIVGEPYEGFG